MVISSKVRIFLTSATAAAALLFVTERATASRYEGTQSSVSKPDTTMKVAQRKMEYSAKKVGGGNGGQEKNKKPPQ